MTDPSITASGNLDKHIRAYDYHTYSYLWAGIGLIVWVMVLPVGLYAGAPLGLVMLVGPAIGLPFLGLCADFRRRRLEISEDGLRYKSIFKRISVPWTQVWDVTEGLGGRGAHRGDYSMVHTEEGKFRLLCYLESADAPTIFKKLFTAWPMSCYWEVMEEIGRRAKSQWTLDSDWGGAASPTHRRWALFGRVLVYCFSIVMVLICIWVILRS
jgi:hypothetical protein